GATITPLHQLYNFDIMQAGAMRPRPFYIPMLNRNRRHQTLSEATTSEILKFLLGTIAAPHAHNRKEAACGCAGSYTANAALELYAEAFEDAGALDKLEGFASHFGPDFYQLPRNTDTITLVKQSWQVPDSLTLGDQSLIPLRAGETLRWQVQK